MNVRKLSVNKACIFLAVLLLAAMMTVSVALYALTQDITAVWYVLLFGIFVLFCSICFMVLVRRKLAMFSDAFCSLMDDMLSGNMQPKQTVEEESLFYKIEWQMHRILQQTVPRMLPPPCLLPKIIFRASSQPITRPMMQP